MEENASICYLQMTSSYFSKNWKTTYKCVFSGYNTYQTLSSLLGNQYWSVRYYKYNQVSYIVLFIQTIDEDLVLALDALITKKVAKKVLKKKNQNTIDKEDPSLIVTLEKNIAEKPKFIVD
ncbi:7348_t:CDS:2 [Scutellospora calospora]|uniref:7348_t:CDS:1 n=1 Tax=Scutellospora calospora TaxID=85575 RepID=A0ACA9L7B2_9GLOM|nr:7348_t:CDS:2 [Scutellospora calospora]